MKYPCPCCGQRTYVSAKRDSYEVCPVCFWEDDLVQFEDPSFSGGANEVSLQEARENYRAFKASGARFVKAVRPPAPEEIP
ncbi:CPCC family cysteine-rich protein [Caulobacter sp. 17J80-11]|uniref:CPCC family cysteine-rich protein n=1 Tax=Caulobacter sp. 17J80-11 TaxID=2763502 RepID=UPI0016538AC2|nr:hydrolase [Caulobacter sp. 17J80-11]